MNKEDYKIDPSSIDEKHMLSKTRQDWINDRLNLQSRLFQRMSANPQTVGSVEMVANEIKRLQERIDYIDEVLERWYSDMCIRCGKLTIVDTYCGQALNCKHCISAIVNRVVANLSEDDLESMEKQLTDLEEGD